MKAKQKTKVNSFYQQVFNPQILKYSTKVNALALEEKLINEVMAEVTQQEYQDILNKQTKSI